MLDILNNDILIMLKNFRLPYHKLEILTTMAVIYEINDFGVLVVGMDGKEYGQVATTLSNRYEDYRIVYITPDDMLKDKKEELFWELMRSGYMIYIRSEYPRQFNEMLRRENLDKRIITKRLEIYGDKAKYKWLVEENKAALNEASSYVLSMNPGFFDYMPEV